MILIGLTGTIGTGKSLVASIMSELGAEVIDTDEVSRIVVEPGTRGYKEIVETWGEKVINPSNELDREKLADIVFNDEHQRKKLNSILHPLIIEKTFELIKASYKDIIVLAVPLLFESGMDKMVTQKWVVTADEDEIVSRIQKRDGCGKDQALKRIASQMSQKEKMERADVIIDNSGKIEETRSKVKEAMDRIEKL